MKQENDWLTQAEISLLFLRARNDEEIQYLRKQNEELKQVLNKTQGENQ